MLNEQLKDQISTEGEAISAKFKDNNDYQSGIIQGFNNGYEVAGYKYADKWQEEKELRERYENALKDIIAALYGISNTVANDIEKIANEALTPKTTTDERGL